MLDWILCYLTKSSEKMTFVREWIGSIPEVHGDLDDSTLANVF